MLASEIPNFSQQLLDWKGEHGLSDLEAAAALEISPDILEEWEQGREIPTTSFQEIIREKMNEAK